MEEHTYNLYTLDFTIYNSNQMKQQSKLPHHMKMYINIFINLLSLTLILKQLNSNYIPIYIFKLTK